jgi:hypothetical protein
VASNFSSPSTALQQKRKIGLPGYVLGILLVLGGSLFIYYLQFAPKRSVAEAPLTPEARAYVGNLKLADVNMKATKNYFGQIVVEIEGNIANAGDRNLDAVEIYCVFRDPYGQLVLRQRLPIVSPRMGGLKPGESKAFRLPFDQLPESWDQKMPILLIAAVKFS